MTLKTTKELTADSLWAKAVGVYYGSSQIGAPIFTGISKERFDEVVRPAIENLCHDADRAGELERELYGMQLAYLALGNKSLKDLDAANLSHAQEIADLRAKLDEAYERAALICDEATEYYEQRGGEAEAMISEGLARKIHALKEQEKCPHGTGLTDYCLSCGRIHGGG